MVTQNRLPILGTPLLYKVNQDTIGKAVPVFDRSLHNLAIQASNFGGGNVTIEWSLDNITWSVLIDNGNQPAIFTQNTLKMGFILTCIYLRASLSGSINADNVTVTLG